jgi:hypothetical protein
MRYDYGLVGGARATEDVPITFPLVFQTVIAIFRVTPLGFAMATVVVESVSFQLSVLHVEAALEKGTTAS